MLSEKNVREDKVLFCVVFFFPVSLLNILYYLNFQVMSCFWKAERTQKTKS